MKIFLLFIGLSATTWGQTSNENWAIQQLMNLAPNEYLILKNYDEMPNEYSIDLENGSISSYKTGGTYEYLSGETKLDILHSLSTNVHEINHGLTNGKAFMECKKRGVVPGFDDLLYYYQYPNGQGDLLVSSIRFFPSRELVSEIPTAKRTFRFEPYIDGNTSTQSHGLLGLLDEYNAYLHSLATHFLLKEAYIQGGADKLDNYITWSSQMKSLEEAYYEFNFFVLLYLDYARRNETQVFNSIKADSRFAQVYNSITRQFQNLILKIEDERSIGLADFAKRNNFSIKIESGTCWLKSGNVSRGFSTKYEDREKLIGDLNSNRFDQTRHALGLLK